MVLPYLYTNKATFRNKYIYKRLNRKDMIRLIGKTSRFPPLTAHTSKQGENKIFDKTQTNCVGGLSISLVWCCNLARLLKINNVPVMNSDKTRVTFFSSAMPTQLVTFEEKNKLSFIYFLVFCFVFSFLFLMVICWSWRVWPCQGRIRDRRGAIKSELSQSKERERERERQKKL